MTPVDVFLFPSPSKLDIANSQLHSLVSFLPGLALMKTTVLESMHTLSYFRLATLTVMVGLSIEFRVTVMARDREWIFHCFFFPLSSSDKYLCVMGNMNIHIRTGPQI